VETVVTFVTMLMFVCVRGRVLAGWCSKRLWLLLRALFHVLIQMSVSRILRRSLHFMVCYHFCLCHHAHRDFL